MINEGNTNWPEALEIRRFNLSTGVFGSAMSDKI